MGHGNYYSRQTGFVTLAEIYDLVRDGDDVTIICNDEDKKFLSMIHMRETGYKNHTPRNSKFRDGDSRLLSRILRAGGMIEYIKKLEGELGGQ